MASSTVNKLDKLREKNRNRKEEKTSNDKVQSKNTFNYGKNGQPKHKKVHGRLCTSSSAKKIFNCRHVVTIIFSPVNDDDIIGTDSIPPTREHLNGHIFPSISLIPGEIVKTLLKCNQEARPNDTNDLSVPQRR